MPVRTGELRIGPGRRESRVELPFSGLADPQLGSVGNGRSSARISQVARPDIKFPVGHLTGDTVTPSFWDTRVILQGQH